MKRVCIAVWLLLICLILCSCAGPEPNFEELFSYTESEETSSEPFAQNVYLIIPQGASSVIHARASTLASEIQSKTGVVCTVKYDNEEIISNKNNLEILLGRTNRIISREATENLRLGEYVCRWDRGSIVLGGRDEEATLLSIDEFCDKILCGSSGASLMNENAYLENKCNFDVKKATVNGYDLYDFTLAYAEDNDFERDVALVLRDHIANISGYYLDISPYKSLGSSRKKVISFGDILVDDQSKSLYPAFVAKSGDDIIIYGKDSYGLSSSAYAFVQQLILHTDGNMTADISELIPVDCLNKELRICSIISDGSANLDYIGKLADKLREADSDVILFGKIKTELVELISINLEEQYSYSALPSSDGYVFLTVYDARTVESLECQLGNEGLKISAKDKTENTFSMMLSSSGLLGKDAQSSDIVILLDEKNADTLKGHGFVLLDSHTASLGQAGQYTRHVYINMKNLAVEGEHDKSFDTAENIVNSFIAFDVKLKYSSQFRGLANALD